MRRVYVKPGDAVCISKDTAVQHGIIGHNRIMSIDNDAKYGHVLVVINRNGDTIESTAPRICRKNLYADYAGCDVLIGRHLNMNAEAHEKGMAGVAHLEGKGYPYLRIALFMLPYNLPKYIHFGIPVCSEFLFLYYRKAEMPPITWHWGVTPDFVADAIRRWDVFDPIFEGRI